MNLRFSCPRIARTSPFRSVRMTNGRRIASCRSKSASGSGSPLSRLTAGGTMAETVALYETDDRVGFVTLNRPDKLNALNADLRRDLAAALTRADEDRATSVVVLRGAGRSFCVGYDISGSSGGEEGRRDALKYHERLSASLQLET